MRYFVYIIYSVKYRRFYTSMTANLKRRLYEHNGGFVKPTKAYSPWKLAYNEVFQTRLEARAREKYFKSGDGRELRNKLLKLNIPG